MSIPSIQSGILFCSEHCVMILPVRGHILVAHQCICFIGVSQMRRSKPLSDLWVKVLQCS